VAHYPPTRIALFAAIAAGGLVVDLWSKGWMFAQLGLPNGPTWWMWEGYFGFQTSLNEGALFGLGQGKAWLFAGFSVCAAVAIVYWLFVVGAAQDRLLTVALGGVLAGVLGNLYDRLGMWWTSDIPTHYPRYAVRDWILLQYGNWVWPNFNVADMLLVGGAGLLILHTWLTPDSAAATTTKRT
jgi:signal peptidase II